MRALVFENELHYRSDYPMPRAKNDEALIRVTLAGICRTDLEITKGYMGFNGVLGHEFVGVVERCGKGDIIGERVVGEINLGCGNCSYCGRQMHRHCPNRSVLGILNKDGVFAEYATLPVENLHIVPDSVSDEEAVFTEPLAAAFEILEQIDIASSDKVCVLGDGKLGLLVGQVLSTINCDLIVVGRHKDKLCILENLGIQTKLSSSFKEKECDVVVDCTGSQSGIETAVDVVKPGGRIIVKTTIAERGRIDLNRVVVNELSLIGSRCGPFPPAIKAIESGQIELYPLISGRFALEDGVKAFRQAFKRDAIKIILRVD